jgi:hypothetical protein
MTSAQRAPRLPESIFERACEHVGAAASGASAMIWRQLRVCIIDATTCRAPRTPDNTKAFGHGSSRFGKSVLPVVRLALLICAGSAAVLCQRIGAYGDGELRLFYSMLPAIPAGALIIADGAYNSFLTLWQIQLRHGHALCPVDPTRRPEFVRQLGYQDELQRWKRPSHHTTAFPELVPQAPETMLVRVIRRSVRRKGYRTWTLTICTTLLDAQTYPADELAELYLQRWGIEGDIRALKDTLDLRRLTAKTTGIVRKEILSGILAYNLVRAIASNTEANPRKLSFERTRTLFVEFCIRMSNAATVHLPRLYKQLLELVSAVALEFQIRPPEPRAIIQHPTCYPVLKGARQAWRKKLHAVS